MATPQQILDGGDLNQLALASKKAKLGTLLYAGGVRMVRETVAVASAACTPTFAVLQLLYAKTIATGTPAVKAAQINGATPSAGQAAPNAGGTSVAFHAETTGTGTADLVYLTAAAPTDATGLATDLPGTVTP